MFDPYRAWLGISSTKRPVNYYQLLGISPDETDARAVKKAAAARLERLEAHREGRFADECERLEQEIDKAKATLLDPDKRARYDAKVLDRDGPPAAASRSKSPNRKKKSADEVEEQPSGNPWLWVGLGGGAFAVLVIGLVIFFLTRPAPVVQPEETPVAVAPAPKPAPPPPPPPVIPEVKPVVVPTPPPPPPPPQSTPRPPKPKKLPVPSQADQDKAEKALKEQFKAEYALTKPDDRLALAAKFLQPGREDRKDVPGWYVLLREARELSVLAGRPRLAVEAIDEIDKWFEIDPVDMKVQALTAVSKLDVPEGPAAELAVRKAMAEATTKALAAVARREVDVAATADSYDNALKLLDLAVAAQTKLKAEAKVLTKLTETKDQILKYQKEYQPVREAKAVLAKTPDDPAANLTVGSHLCLNVGQFDDGLPLLAKSAPGDLEKGAKDDLFNPNTAPELGDFWWERARRTGGRGEDALRDRAVEWYTSALAKAVGNDKKRAEERIQERTRELRERDTGKLPRLIPGSFQGRGPEDHILLLREGGGTMKSEEAVEKGLNWIVAHQEPTGGWSLKNFNVPAVCSCGERADQPYEVAATAFGLLPLLAAGQTQKNSPRFLAVNKGLRALLKKQKPTGNFSDNAYENALATMAVCEAYALTAEPGIKKPAQAALDYIAAQQQPTGGWGYSKSNPPDTSVTGWQFSALKAGALAGLKVNPLHFQQLGSYLELVADPAGNGFGYKDTTISPAPTATGLMCREYLGYKPQDPAVKKIVAQLMKPENLASRETPKLYFVFYSTQALHHFGGADWQTWNTRTRDLLIELQDQGSDFDHTHQKGSWSPAGGEWAKEGGRLMFTSLALLTLQSYYATVPLNGYGSAVRAD
jgi:hypothetical protein